MALINFLRKHNTDQDPNSIIDAVDYALKNKPSFGGFIFTCWENSRILAAALVNKTGMSGNQPGNQMVYANLSHEHSAETEILEELIRKSIRHAKGEIGLHLKPDHPALPIFRSLGFQEQYVELRFASPKVVSAGAAS